VRNLLPLSIKAAASLRREIKTRKTRTRKMKVAAVAGKYRIPAW
jgi:hypothetical protein